MGKIGKISRYLFHSICFNDIVGRLPKVRRIHIDTSDRFRVQIFNATMGLKVDVKLWLRLRNGQMIVWRKTFISETIDSFDVDLGQISLYPSPWRLHLDSRDGCFLRGVAVTTPTPAKGRGCYVAVHFVRPVTQTVQLCETLISDYINLPNLKWPKGHTPSIFGSMQSEMFAAEFRKDRFEEARRMLSRQRQLELKIFLWAFRSVYEILRQMRDGEGPPPSMLRYIPELASKQRLSPEQLTSLEILRLALREDRRGRSAFRDSPAEEWARVIDSLLTDERKAPELKILEHLMQPTISIRKIRELKTQSQWLNMGLLGLFLQEHMDWFSAIVRDKRFPKHPSHLQERIEFVAQRMAAIYAGHQPSTARYLTERLGAKMRRCKACGSKPALIHSVAHDERFIHPWCGECEIRSFRVLPALHAILRG